MRWSIFWFAALVTAPSAANAQVGALQADCRLGGPQQNGSYQFVATCAGRSASPDGRFAVVQKAYQGNQPAIEFQDRRGRVLGRLRSLSDDMPFSVFWAPNSRWFFVNHHVGSFMDTLQVFQIIGGAAVERKALPKAAASIAATRYPCLYARMVNPNGFRWSRDGKRIVMFTVSRTDACTDFARRPGKWHSLWMIGDVRTGQIERTSIRVQPDDGPFKMPRNGLYSRLSWNGSFPPSTVRTNTAAAHMSRPRITRNVRNVRVHRSIGQPE